MTVITGILKKGHKLESKDATYVIQEKISEGSFGVLYKAEKVSSAEERSIVAIKQLNPIRSVSSDTIRIMLNNETVMLSNLHQALSKHVPKYHEQFEFEGVIYLVMNFVEGMTLDKWLMSESKGGLPLDRMAKMLAPIAKMLFGMHQWSHYHGDLSPKNIMITKGKAEGETGFYFIDFGFGVYTGWGQESAPEVIFGAGTPGYVNPLRSDYPSFDEHMKPERRREILNEYMLSRDFYGIVAIAYFLLKGKDPYLSNLGLDQIEEPAKSLFMRYLADHEDIWEAIKKEKMTNEEIAPFEVEQKIFLDGIAYKEEVTYEGVEYVPDEAALLLEVLDSLDEQESEGSKPKESEDKENDTEEPSKEGTPFSEDLDERHDSGTQQTTDSGITKGEISVVNDRVGSKSKEFLSWANKHWDVWLMVAGLIFILLAIRDESKKKHDEHFDPPSKADTVIVVTPRQPLSEAESDAEIYTNRFADFYGGRFSRDEMLRFFTEDCYFLVRKEGFLEGNRTDPLYSVKRLLSDGFEPDYMIGSEYKVVHVERDAKSGLVKRIIIERMSKLNF